MVMEGIGGASTTPKSITSSKLLNIRPLDISDELDKSWNVNYHFVKKLIAEKDEQSALHILGTHAVEKYEQLNLGLLYGILTEGKLAPSYNKLLSHICRDGFQFCSLQLQKLIVEKYHKLLDPCRTQLLWLSREFIFKQVADFENVIISLLRQIIGGDCSARNVFLAQTLLDILDQQRPWLLQRHALIPYIFHTYTRIAIDHVKPQHAALRDKEASLCTFLWNEKQTDVALLGRELVRILHEAKEIAGFAAIWKQLRSTPDPRSGEELTRGPVTVPRLMATKTPRKYLQARITKDMEDQLRFLMTNVHLGQQKRYQQWFTAKFLSTREAESLIPDLVRYICGVYHPSNEVLQSKVIPRWAVIGWLIKCCKTPGNDARTKLALFFDYLYFHKGDNIMNVEPAILLMVQSLKNYPDITLSLLQYLMFAVENFAASAFNRQMMKKGVSYAFTMLRKLGVVSSLSPLVSFQALSKVPELRDQMKRIFPEHFNNPHESLPTTEAEGAISITGTTSQQPSSVVTHPTPSSIHGSPTLKHPLAPAIYTHCDSPSGSPLRNNSPAHYNADRSYFDSPSRLNDDYASSRSDSEGERLSIGVQGSTSSSASSPTMTTPLASGFSHPNRKTSPELLLSSQSPERVPVVVVESSPTNANNNNNTNLSSNSTNNNNNVFSSSSETNSETSIVVESISPPRSVDKTNTLRGISDQVAQLLDSLKESSKKEISKTGLSNLLNAWVKCDNASEMAVELGEVLHQSMSDHFLLAQIPTNLSRESTEVDILMLEAINGTHDDLYCKLLTAMIKQQGNHAISFWLLVYLYCKNNQQTKGEGMNTTLDKNSMRIYLLLSHSNDSEVFLNSLVRDILACQQVHEANSVALAVKNLSKKGNLSAIEFTCLELLPWLCRMFDPVLSGQEMVIRFLVSNINPSQLYSLCCRLSLGEFSLFSSREANTLLASLRWDSFEQSSLWLLLSSEVASKNGSCSKNLLTALRQLLACIEPVENPEALSGILQLLRFSSPDSSLLQYIFKLSDSFGIFPDCVITSWGNSHSDVVNNFILDMLSSDFAQLGDEYLVLRVLRYLEHMKAMGNDASLQFLTQENVRTVLVKALDMNICKTVPLEFLRKMCDGWLEVEEGHPLKKVKVDITT